MNTLPGNASASSALLKVATLLVLAAVTDVQGKELRLVTLAEIPEESHAPPRAGALHPTRTIIATSGPDYKISVWDYANKQKLATLRLLEGASDTLTSSPLAFSPDGTMLAACHSRVSDGTALRLWDAKTWQLKKDIVTNGPAGGCSGIGFSTDGRRLFMATTRTVLTDEPNLLLIDLADYHTLWSTTTVPYYIGGVAAAGSDTLVAAGTYRPPRSGDLPPHPWNGTLPPGSHLTVFSANDGRLVRSIRTVIKANAQAGLAVSPDASLAAVANGGGWQLFSIATGALKAQVEDRGGSAKTSLTFSADGKYLLQTQYDNAGFFKIWDLAGQPVWTRNGPVGPVASRPDGIIAVGFPGKTVIGTLRPED